MSAETKIVEKRKQSLLKREKGYLVISHRKLENYCRFQTELNCSYHNHPVLHEDMIANQLLLQNQYRQNLISNNLFISQILLYSLLLLRILLSIFRHSARDLKDSFQAVTVPQLMPKIVVQTSQQSYLPNQNLTSYPTFPNPLPNLYVIATLKYCHKNVSVCYGCSRRFRENGYPYLRMI